MQKIKLSFDVKELEQLLFHLQNDANDIAKRDLWKEYEKVDGHTSDRASRIIDKVKWELNKVKSNR